MIDMKDWTEKFLAALDDCFGNRVWFAGLQGSRGRGEAAEASDIDMVVILDELRAADIAAYSTMLDGLPHRELSCGFLSGRAEICAWEPSDLFQLYFDTTPIRGSLNELLPLLDDDAVARAIRIDRKWQLTPVFLFGKSQGHRNLVGFSPWGCKESDLTD